MGQTEWEVGGKGWMMEGTRKRRRWERQKHSITRAYIRTCMGGWEEMDEPLKGQRREEGG